MVSAATALLLPLSLPLSLRSRSHLLQRLCLSLELETILRYLLPLSTPLHAPTCHVLTRLKLTRHLS